MYLNPLKLKTTILNLIDTDDSKLVYIQSLKQKLGRSFKSFASYHVKGSPLRFHCACFPRLPLSLKSRAEISFAHGF